MYIHFEMVKGGKREEKMDKEIVKQTEETASSLNQGDDEEYIMPSDWITKKKEELKFTFISENIAYLVDSKKEHEPVVFKLTGKVLSSQMGKTGSFRENVGWKLNAAYRVLSNLNQLKF